MLPTNYTTICRNVLPLALIPKCLIRCIAVIYLFTYAPQVLAQDANKQDITDPSVWSVLGGQHIPRITGTEKFTYSESGKYTRYNEVIEGNCVRTMEIFYNNDRIVVHYAVKGIYTLTRDESIDNQGHHGKHIFKHIVSGNYSQSSNDQFFSVSPLCGTMFINNNLGIARILVPVFITPSCHVDISETGVNAQPPSSFEANGPSMSPSDNAQRVIRVPNYSECNTLFSEKWRKLETAGVAPRSYLSALIGSYIEARVQDNKTSGSCPPVQLFDGETQAVWNARNALALQNHQMPKDITQTMSGTLKVSWNLSTKLVDVVAAKNLSQKESGSATGKITSCFSLCHLRNQSKAQASLQEAK